MIRLFFFGEKISVFTTPFLLLFATTPTANSGRNRILKIKCLLQKRNPNKTFRSKLVCFIWIFLFVTTDEWNRFYSFVFRCVKLYLQKGIRKTEYNKTGDNFKACFYNDAIYTEFERIISILIVKDCFNVSDFY